MKTKRKCKKPHPCITQTRVGKAEGSVLVGTTPQQRGVNQTVSPRFLPLIYRNTAADVRSTGQNKPTA